MNRTSLLLVAAAVLVVVALASTPGRTSPAPARRPGAVGPSVSAPMGNGLSLTVASPHRALASTGGDAWAVIDVTAAVRELARHRVSLAVVVDTSGSMAGPKMEQAKRAAQSLVRQLGDDDELALVAFDQTARTFARQPMTSEGRRAALSFIETLGPVGATNISEGLLEGERALDRAGGQRRLVLVSDGQPTAGIVDRTQLGQLAAAAHERGVTVTAIGVGDDFDAMLMRSMAERGGGVYGDLRRPEALEIVLADELRQARQPLARNVKLGFQSGSSVDVVAAAGRMLQQGANGPEVTLPDFGSGASARVFVKLRHGGGFGALQLAPRLEWTTPEGHRETAEVHLTLPLSEDRASIEASRDEALFADVMRAFGNEQMVLAAEAMERGERSSALALLDKARSLFRSSADALAGEEPVLAEKARLWKSAGYDAHKESKDMMRKSLTTFGQTNNALY